uniref:Uncharacterized protein n=1 Tax=Rhizophora mucronata TaxID=61149 RepID=A0A2P2JMB9_RHIMU
MQPIPLFRLYYLEVNKYRRRCSSWDRSWMAKIECNWSFMQPQLIKLMGKFYQTMIRIAILYDSKIWTTKKDAHKRSDEDGIIGICSYSRKY